MRNGESNREFDDCGLFLGVKWRTMATTAGWAWVGMGNERRFYALPAKLGWLRLKEKPMATSKQPGMTNELIAVELAQNDGNVAAVARRFSVSRQAILKRINKSEPLQQILEDAREGMLDEGEASLYRAVKQGEAWAVCFFLKTQGKRRGYTEKNEIAVLAEQLAAIKKVLDERATKPGGPDQTTLGTDTPADDTDD